MPQPQSPTRKPLEWIGPSRKTLRKFPEDVQDEIGFALFQAECGAKHKSSKALKGFGSAGVVEVVADHEGSTYRAVYTVRFRLAVYVLHAFQKKSKSGISTPKHEIDLIKQRLHQATEHYAEHYDQTK